MTGSILVFDHLERELEEVLRQDDYDAAVLLLRTLQEKRTLSVDELVLLSKCMQLASDELNFELEDVKEVLQEALRKSPDHAEALIEMGYYLFVHEDSALEALPLFERAVSIEATHLAYAIEGKAKCAEELDSPKAAVEILDSVTQEVAKVERIKEYRQFLDECIGQEVDSVPADRRPT